MFKCESHLPVALLLLGAYGRPADAVDTVEPAPAVSPDAVEPAIWKAPAPSTAPGPDQIGGHEGRWDWGAQLTSINQFTTRAPGAYANPALSFATRPSFGWSLTASLFGAVSPWTNGLFVVMPEFANGRGLPTASGLAAYPNSDIVRVPALGKEPTSRAPTITTLSTFRPSRWMRCQT